MSITRWVHSYLKQFEPTDFERIEDGLRAVGFELTKPETQAIIAVRDLDEMDLKRRPDEVDKEVSRDWIRACLEGRSPMSLVLWGTDWSDIMLSVSYPQDVVELSLTLGNVVGTESEGPMIELLLGELRQAVRQGNALGMVVDPEGYTEEVDWEGFFLRGDRFRGPLPRIMAVPVSMLGQIATKTDRARKETLQDFVIFHTDYAPLPGSEAP